VATWFKVVHRIDGTETSITDDGGINCWSILEQAEREGLAHIQGGAKPANVYLVEVDEQDKVISERRFGE
jgi:hypothetical protein